MIPGLQRSPRFKSVVRIRTWFGSEFSFWKERRGVKVGPIWSVSRWARSHDLGRHALCKAAGPIESAGTCGTRYSSRQHLLGLVRPLTLAVQYTYVTPKSVLPGALAVPAVLNWKMLEPVKDLGPTWMDQWVTISKHAIMELLLSPACLWKLNGWGFFSMVHPMSDF